VARRKRREGHSLHKVLGVGALFSTAYGNVGSSIYYALGVVAAAALGLTPLVFIITGCLFIATAWSYSEATAAMPEAGGASSFTRRAFNEFASFGIGWAQMLTYTATIAISALFVPQYLSIFWPILKEPPYNVIGGAITIVILVVLNIVGIKEAASLNVVLALLDLGTQVLIMIIALVLLLEPKILIDQIQLGVAPTWSQFLYGLAMGTVAYTGIETISNMAEEAQQPAKDVPRSINFVIVAVLVVYIGMPLAALSSMKVDSNTVPVNPATGMTEPVQVVPGQPKGTFVLKSDPSVVVYVPLRTLSDGTTVIPAQEPTGEVTTVDGQQVTKLYGTQLGSNYVADPVLGMVRFLPDNVAWLRWILGPWVGILAGTILFIATNAGLIGVSRLAFSLGQHRQLPRVLGRVHPTRLTPYVAVIFFGIIAVILILPGEIPLLADLYAFGSMISFTAAHVSVIVLRRKEPELERPFRAPLNVTIAGTTVPMTAVLGAMGTFAVWVVIVSYKPMSGLIGMAWVGFGLVAYVIFRKAQGYSLTKTIKSPTLPLTLTEDVVYDQLLVPVRDTSVSEEMMVLACQLATERKSSIDALYVIEVPLNLPIDASLPEERERARQVLERAAQAADMFNVKLTPVVVTARSAGRAIVDEAIARRSEVIVLGSQGKRRIADKVFGRTIDHVLDNLPCEAIINVIPKTPATRTASVGVVGSVSVVSRAAIVAEPADEAVRAVAKPGVGSGEAARTGRRAQGLHLSRYLPARPGPNGSGSPDGNGDGKAGAGDGASGTTGAEPERDTAVDRGDSGAA
jgi:basic amino acid/polyamine antiporter, APA family